MKLLKLDVTCPECGRTPGIRIFPRERDLHEDEPPETPVKMVKCKCGETFVVTAKAYQEAA